MFLIVNKNCQEDAALWELFHNPLGIQIMSVNWDYKYIDRDTFYSLWFHCFSSSSLTLHTDISVNLFKWHRGSEKLLDYRTIDGRINGWEGIYCWDNLFNTAVKTQHINIVHDWLLFQCILSTDYESMSFPPCSALWTLRATELSPGDHKNNHNY